MDQIPSTSALSTDRLIRLPEFSERLACSEGWVLARVKNGTIPAVHLGRELRFLESTLLQLMNRGLPAASLVGRRSSRSRTTRRRLALVRVDDRAIRVRRSELERFIAAGERPALPR